MKAQPKFKVGDVVKVVKDEKLRSWKVGEVFRIKAFDERGATYCYWDHIVGENGKHGAYGVFEECLAYASKLDNILN